MEVKTRSSSLFVLSIRPAVEKNVSLSQINSKYYNFRSMKTTKKEERAESNVQDKTLV